MNKRKVPGTAEKILIFLRAEKSGYVSGEALSRKLLVTRTAVWKHVHALVKQGYSIGSSTRLGYRLTGSPDRLLAAEIREGLLTKYLGKELYCYDEIGSTNETAMKLAGTNTEEGAVVIAEKQNSGKGRLNRKWLSPAGAGLWFSVILRPRIAPRQATDLTFVAGLALVQALHNFTGLEAGLKWPNDIFLDGKKVCGILTEINAGPDLVRHMALGIGINVNMSKAAFPAEIKDSATSLSLAAGREISRLGLLKEVLGQLEEKYELYKRDGFSSFIAEWKKRSVTLNKRVRIKGLAEEYEGFAVDINKDGGLVVRLDSGELKKVYSGDVT